MKKLCSVLLVLMLILSLTACGGSADGEEANNDNTPSTENSSGGSETPNAPEGNLPPSEGENTDVPAEPAPPSEGENTDVPVEPTVPDDSQNSDIPAEPTTPDAPVYTVIISEEWADGPVDSWQITGVFAEGVGYASSGLPLRILYTVSGSSATILRSFYPDDYPYIGAYVDNGDGTFTCDYSQLEDYGQWEVFDEDGMSVCAAGSGYPSLPDGSWYFGAVRESNSFYIVVGNPDAAANGTIPSM